MPVSLFRSVNVAFGMADPLGSATVPSMELVNCAHPEHAQNTPAVRMAQRVEIPFNCIVPSRYNVDPQIRCDFPKMCVSATAEYTPCLGLCQENFQELADCQTAARYHRAPQRVECVYTI